MHLLIALASEFKYAIYLRYAILPSSGHLVISYIPYLLSGFCLGQKWMTCA